MSLPGQVHRQPGPDEATTVLHLGTRGSPLALRQAEQVRQLMRKAWPMVTLRITVIETRGDQSPEQPLPQIGGKGLFTEELNDALRHHRIDLAVHSLKDLPIDDIPGLAIGAILEREDPRDALVSRLACTSLASLPAGAVVATGSPRRAAQILRHRPDLRVAPLRGNVDTRWKKVLDPSAGFDATLLALAGLNRLGLTGREIAPIDPEAVLPAPGQGALAIQCRADDAVCRNLLASLDHTPTRLAVTAERAFLAALGGGCS
ncbi:MAG: hydroxymethylbilane synthase, partial [Phycisphaerales bacterium]|nr:hydroxymethylbilane synthase [Phycisphaerales bacterium]